MHYRNFKDGIRLSALGMGNMRLPTDASGEIDYTKGKEIIDYAYKNGINYYDTAYIYHGGKSEMFLGEALAEYPRVSYFLADKYNLANLDYKEEFEEQRTRLRTDSIDFYMLHGLQDNTADRYLTCGALEYFHSLMQEGKIRYLGVSVHCSPAKFEQIMNAYDWDFVQLQLNYYDWLYGDAKTLYDMADARQIPVMVMEPVRGGKLASLTPEANEKLRQSEPERSIASWAFRWVAALPRVAIVLSGMSNMEQIVDNIATFADYKPLSEAQNKLLLDACAVYRPSVSVACTSCRYCCDDCPQGLDIPRLLSVYNDVKLGGEWRLDFLGDLTEDKMPSACVACGLCTGHCPQGFDIPAYFQEMAKLASR